MTESVFRYQAAKYAGCVDNEITETCMPTRYEQLQEFNETSEDDQINREQAALLVEP